LDLSTGLKAARLEGREEGRQQGRQEGRQEGEKRGKIGMIHLCERLLKIGLQDDECIDGDPVSLSPTHFGEGVKEEPKRSFQRVEIKRTILQEDDLNAHTESIMG
jgi:hypothetical protein